MSTRYNPYGLRRESESDRDHRDRRPPPPSTRDERERAQTRPSTRESHESRTPDSKPEHEKAELAHLFRELFDHMDERRRLLARKTNEEKLLRRKEVDYNSMIGASQFNAVEESLQRHRDVHKKTIEAIDKDLARLDQKITRLEDNFGDRIIKNTPISEVRHRQMTEAVKKEIALQNPVQDDRLEKLEQQLSSLVESQKLQADELSKLKEENDKLRDRNAAYEAQAVELAALKKQSDQIKRLVEAHAAREEGITASEEKRNELARQMCAVRAKLDGLHEKVESQKDELEKSLKEVKSQNNLASSVDAVPSIHALTALKAQVGALNQQLSAFDATEYTEAMEKLVDYPSWKLLSLRLGGYESAIQTLQKPIARANDLRADEDKQRQGLDARLKAFSDEIVQFCGSKMNNLGARLTTVEDQVKGIETQAPSVPTSTAVASVPSASQIPSVGPVHQDASFVELKGDLAALRDEFRAVRNDIDALRTFAQQTRTAHELMIQDLNSRFNNMSTIEMAQIILDNIKRLPQSTVSLDVQNLHERLAGLEEIRNEELRTRSIFEDIDISMHQELQEVRNAVSNGRIGRKFVPRKRQRVAESDGIPNEREED